jgi:hypothetical protein
VPPCDKANDKIAKENAAFLNRLNNIRPSKDLAGSGGAAGRPGTGGGSRPGSRQMGAHSVGLYKLTLSLKAPGFNP